MNHIKNCSAYGGFPCDCQERVECAIIAWARDYLAREGNPISLEEQEKLRALFKELDERVWS